MLVRGGLKIYCRLSHFLFIGGPPYTPPLPLAQSIFILIFLVAILDFTDVKHVTGGRGGKGREVEGREGEGRGPGLVFYVDFNPFLKIIMVTKYFKMDFSVKKITSFTPLLSTVSKLYYTYYHLRLLMIVCIVLIWFLLTVLHESENKNQISTMVFSPSPSPFSVQSQLKKKKTSLREG